MPHILDPASVTTLRAAVLELANGNRQEAVDALNDLPPDQLCHGGGLLAWLLDEARELHVRRDAHVHVNEVNRALWLALNDAHR